MANYFVATSGGSDSNDGLDAFGFNLSTATWTAATRVITQVGVFEFYSLLPGDRIYLSHSSITDGLFEIEEKVSDNVIKLVDIIFGSNLSSVNSSDGPWDTIIKAKDTMVAGDSVFLCTIGTEQFNEAGAIILLVAGDTTSGPISWIGAGPQGAVGTLAEVLDQFQIREELHVFQYIHMVGTSFSIDAVGDNGKSIIFYRCGASGVSEAFTTIGTVDNSPLAFIDCFSFDITAGGRGIRLNTGNTLTGLIYGGSFEGGVTTDSFTALVGVLGYDNSGSNFSNCKYTINCTAYSAGGDNFIQKTSTDPPGIFMNNIAYDAGEFGLDGNDATGDVMIVLNNSFGVNGSGATDNIITESDILEVGRFSDIENPFVDADGGNFELNHHRAGLLNRGRGYPSSMATTQDDLTPTTIDRGAVQTALDVDRSQLA